MSGLGVQCSVLGWSPAVFYMYTEVGESARVETRGKMTEREGLAPPKKSLSGPRDFFGGRPFSWRAHAVGPFPPVRSAEKGVQILL